MRCRDYPRKTITACGQIGQGPPTSTSKSDPVALQNGKNFFAAVIKNRDLVAETFGKQLLNPVDAVGPRRSWIAVPVLLWTPEPRQRFSHVADKQRAWIDQAVDETVYRH